MIGLSMFYFTLIISSLRIRARNVKRICLPSSSEGKRRKMITVTESRETNACLSISKRLPTSAVSFLLDRSSSRACQESTAKQGSRFCLSLLRCSEVNRKQLSHGYCISEGDLIGKRRHQGQRRKDDLLCYSLRRSIERSDQLFPSRSQTHIACFNEQL